MGAQRVPRRAWDFRLFSQLFTSIKGLPQARLCFTINVYTRKTSELIVNTLVLAIFSAGLTTRSRVRGAGDTTSCLDWGLSTDGKILGRHLAKGIRLASNTCHLVTQTGGRCGRCGRCVRCVLLIVSLIVVCCSSLSVPDPVPVPVAASR